MQTLGQARDSWRGTGTKSGDVSRRLIISARSIPVIQATPEASQTPTPSEREVLRLRGAAVSPGWPSDREPETCATPAPRLIGATEALEGMR